MPGAMGAEQRLSRLLDAVTLTRIERLLSEGDDDGEEEADED